LQTLDTRARAQRKSPEDSFPSFISFPTSGPVSPSSSANSPRAPLAPPRHPTRRPHQARPRNPTPRSASLKSATSQLALPRLDEAQVTPILANAIRHVTLEARLPTHEDDLSVSTAEGSFNNSDKINTTDDSIEYPSYLDSSSGIGGILRSRNSRAPPNTPTLTVHFDESPRARYIRRKALERASSTPPPSSLPDAKFNSGRRWNRLAKIMNALDPQDRSPESDPAEISSDSAYASPASFIESSLPDTPGKSDVFRTFSSSDSPISFARFDNPEPLCSTPLPKFRFPLPPNRYHSARWTHAASISPSSRGNTSSGPDGDASTQTWSKQYEEEGDAEVVEECSALEALLEYGSSSEGEEESGMAVYEESFMTTQDKGRELLGGKGNSRECEAEGSGSRRGSADLLPLKFKGLSVDVDEGECYATAYPQRTSRSADQVEPFPFARSLRF
jgi:hypothetical protein